MKAGREQRPAARAGRAHERGARGDGDEVPETLRRRFAQFRQRSAPGARIPEMLRDAVLDACEQGVSVQALRRELGVTQGQVQSWRCQRSATKAKASAARRLPSARVFDVVDAPAAAGESAALDDRVGSLAGEQVLELRLGGWSLVIRATSR